MTAVLQGVVGLVLTTIAVASEPRPLPVDEHAESLAQVERSFEALVRERQGWEPEPPPPTIVPAPAIRSAATAPVRPLSESPPSVAAVDAFLEGSPLAGLGSVFVDSAARHGVDWRLMAAISLHESSRGWFLCGSYNPFGYGPCWSFASFEAAIETATARFASYGVGTATGLCWWVSGPSGACDQAYVARVLRTMEGIR